MTDTTAPSATAKVPEVTLAFWIVKVLATTLGETAGDTVTMSLHLGYLVGSAIFAAVFAGAVLAQVRAPGFRPLAYWATIVASTTLGTTLADFTTRSLGVGYPGGTLLLLALLLAALAAWWRALGSIAVDTVADGPSEAFYWFAIMCSQTLGTALGDWVADTAGLGYVGAMAIFGGLLAVIVALWAWTRLSRALLFWAAFILTRPLGAVVGDFLDKPVAHGGLALDRLGASLVLLGAMAVLLLALPQRPARRAH